ncbi:MAG: hypothetical protein FWG30_11975 [Eubacteriaceae bacterium]|nr:hypothetical protein [Eubacteriaceae bacterium]
MRIRTIYKKTLAALLLAACTASLYSCGGTQSPPASKAPVNSSSLYTVDTKPEATMLYPVLSKAVGVEYDMNGNPYSYSSASFKLVNENWEDVTGYINGSYDYIFVDGKPFAIQTTDFKSYQSRAYNFDGSIIESLDGYSYFKPWYLDMPLPAGTILVTNPVDPNSEDYQWRIGAFDLNSGKLIIPIEYNQLLFFENSVVGFFDGGISKLDYSGNVLSSQQDSSFYPVGTIFGDEDYILIGNNTFIDTQGDIAFVIDNPNINTLCTSNFTNGIGCAMDRENNTCRFIGTDGETIGVGTSHGYIYREGNYYIADGKEIYDLDLKKIATMPCDYASGIIGDMFIGQTGSESTAYSMNGEALFTIGSYVYEENGLLKNWDSNQLVSIYSMEGKAIAEKCRVANVSPDGKYIYIDDGKQMGYIDLQGEWVYRLESKNYYLND